MRYFHFDASYDCVEFNQIVVIIIVIVINNCVTRGYNIEINECHECHLSYREFGILCLNFVFRLYSFFFFFNFFFLYNNE